ncbi:hypothetical protein BJ742DRAFT_773144 [Cladochytrium replicatum]|nr:hypothetical protein BJ742DRAFT_773144 [Cladochytrium replicatum]
MSQSPASPRLNPHQETTLSKQLAEFVSAEDIPAFAALLEDHELSNPFTLSPADTTTTATLLLCAYIYLNNLDAARFLIKRSSQSTLSDPRFNALHGCVSALWTRDLPTFHATMASFRATFPANTTISAVPTPDELIAAISTRADEAVKVRMLKLVARAYQSISEADAIALLGRQPPVEWIREEVNGVVLVLPSTAGDNGSVQKHSGEGSKQLKDLTEDGPEGRMDAALLEHYTYSAAMEKTDDDVIRAQGVISESVPTSTTAPATPHNPAIVWG